MTGKICILCSSVIKRCRPLQILFVIIIEKYVLGKVVKEWTIFCVLIILYP